MLNFNPELVPRLRRRGSQQSRSQSATRPETGEHEPHVPRAPEFVPAPDSGVDLGLDRLDFSVLKSNQRATAQTVDDGYYRRIFPPHSLFGAVARAHSERYEYAVFANAVDTSRVSGNLWIPRLWTFGRVEFTLYWGGPTGSTNPVRWNLIANSTKPGESYTSAITQINVTADFAGPSAANTWVKNTFASSTSYLQVNSEDELIGFLLTRLGAHANDTYANEAHLLAVALRFIPAVTQSHH